MTHLSPSATVLRVAPASTTFEGRARTTDNTSLHETIAIKREQVTNLESAWVAASEKVAGRAANRHVRMDDRTTWDRATWDRYLAAASARERDFLPIILRLLREIDELAALLATPAKPRPKAAPPSPQPGMARAA